MPRKKIDTNLVTYHELETGLCKDKKPHKIWLSYVGDNWPAFCANCNKHVSDVPHHIRDNF